MDDLSKIVDIINKATVDELPYYLECNKCGLSGIKSNLKYHTGLYGINKEDVLCSDVKKCKRRVRKNRRKHSAN